MLPASLLTIAFIENYRLVKTTSPDGHGSDQAQRSLSPDEQLLQVVPRVVLWQSLHAVQNGAICQHRLKAEHGAVQGAVAQEAQPPCMSLPHAPIASFKLFCTGSEANACFGASACTEA